MGSIISFVLMLLIGCGVLAINLDNFYYSIILTLANFSLCFYIINNNNLSKNILNPQSILMIGFLLFFLGRFIGVLFDVHYLPYTFCIDFIFNYCSDDYDKFNLIVYLNCILIFFAMGFVFPPKKIFYNMIFPGYKPIFYVFLIGVFSTLFSLFDTIQNVYSAVNSGYLAIYAGQSEEYETPYSLLINTVSVSTLAILFSVKDRDDKINKFFKIVFYILIFKMVIGILSGSRASFISACLIMLWYLFRNREFLARHYFYLLGSSVFLITFINKIASLSNARIIDSTNRSFFENIAFVFYNQGITMMVFNSGLKLDTFPILGYLKVLFPGIQVLFKFFGVNERKDFNWSSYMVYNENIVAYYNGNGLGWSLYNDFYALSFGFLPLFCFFIFLFSRFVVKCVSVNGFYTQGLLFIFVTTFFTLNRSSISVLIFSIFVYSFIYLIIVKVRIGGKN